MLTGGPRHPRAKKRPVPSAERPLADVVETSVLRKLLGASTAYRNYLTQQLGPGERRVTDYIRMELIRGVVDCLISFYFTFDLQDTNTILDAKSRWSNRFQGRDVRTVLEYADQAAAGMLVDQADPRAVEPFRTKLADYIWRLINYVDAKFERDTENPTACARALVPFVMDWDNTPASLDRYQKAFSDTRACRARCHVDSYVLRAHQTRVQDLISAGDQAASNSDTKGFKSVTEKLRHLVDKGSNGFTCRTCSEIGDAVIALEVSKAERLVHLDKAFNHLCQVLAVRHFYVKSQSSYSTNVDADPKRDP